MRGVGRGGRGLGTARRFEPVLRRLDKSHTGELLDNGLDRDLGCRHHRCGDPGRVDAGHAQLPPVPGQPEPVRSHGHDREHRHRGVHRPAVSACDGLGCRTDGIQRVGDDPEPGQLAPACIRFRRWFRLPQSAGRSFLRRFRGGLRYGLHGRLHVHEPGFRWDVPDRDLPGRSRGTVRLLVRRCGSWYVGQLQDPVRRGGKPGGCHDRLDDGRRRGLFPRRARLPRIRRRGAGVRHPCRPLRR